MKTIKQHLSKLPSPFREMALKYTPVQDHNMMIGRAPLALVHAFHWTETEEGWEFWYAVFLDFKERTQ